MENKKRKQKSQIKEKKITQHRVQRAPREQQPRETFKENRSKFPGVSPWKFEVTSCSCFKRDEKKKRKQRRRRKRKKRVDSSQSQRFLVASFHFPFFLLPPSSFSSPSTPLEKVTMTGFPLPIKIAFTCLCVTQLVSFFCVCVCFGQSLRHHTIIAWFRGSREIPLVYLVCTGSRVSQCARNNG